MTFTALIGIAALLMLVGFVIFGVGLLFAHQGRRERD